MRKILVGTDLSAQAEQAVAHAMDLGRRHGVEVVLALATAVPDSPAGVDPSTAEAADLYLRSLNKRLADDREQLATLRQHLVGQGVTVSTTVVDGYADEVLPRVAEEVGADLIVVGTHGRTGLRRAFLGSVAERTTRLAGCDVLVVRGDRAPSGGYRHVVVGVDFSEHADRAIERALTQLAAPGARVDLVYCWQIPPLSISPDMPFSAVHYEQLAQGAQAQLGERYAAAAARGVAAGLDVRLHAVQRPASQGLEDWARDHGADLIVTGSHGRRGLRRWVLGSVAEVTIRHAPCSVLVVR